MRVLHVLAETGFSGGEVQLEHLVRHLGAAGHDNHLVLVPGAEFARVAVSARVQVHDVDLRRPLSSLALIAFRRVLRRLAPDIVHFGCGRSLLWGGLAALGRAIPLRITTRRIDYPIGRSLYRGGRYRHLVDHVVANCRAVERRVLDAGVAPERVTLVHEGIDPTPWLGVRGDRAGARSRLGIAADALVVSCAATLRPRKGQRVLIDAFARLAGSDPRALLLLAGAGPDRDLLARRAREHGVAGRVLVPGAIRPVADVYAASDVFVMPSFHEGLSNACLEASAAGLPVVASAVGGLTEIVADGETGSLVPAGDAERLADRIGRLLADDGLRERTGLAGRRRTTEHFTADRMVRNMEALFLRLLAAGQGAGVPRA